MFVLIINLIFYIVNFKYKDYIYIYNSDFEFVWCIVDKYVGQGGFVYRVYFKQKGGYWGIFWDFVIVLYYLYNLKRFKL